MEITATSSGIVTARRVNNGDYVSQGSVLYDVSDLSRVWVQFDAYESDLSFLKKGGKIEFTIQALPGSAYSGTIAFIDPFIDPVNRVAKVRVEIGNPGGKLKPGMFATGVVNANLVEFNNKLVIPRSAVLWTGKRSVVYVKQPGEEPIFHLREVELGPALRNSFVIVAGLADGEEIATEGAFSVDAAAQLEGKPSMMNPAGGIVSTGHNHGTPETVAGDEDHAAHQKQPVTNTNIQHQTVKVSGNCEMCKERIETAAKSVNGVVSAEWGIETKMLHVQFDGSKTNTDVIQKAVAAVGHDTKKFKAPDEVYKTLQVCCLFRNN
jgi:Cu(I)/Ag(I) efflux system membrane fusion protein